MTGLALRSIASRIAQGMVSLFLLVTVVFFLSRLTGNPLDLLVPADATPAFRAQVSKNYGLDRPLIEQYWIYLEHLVRGDLGNSLQYGTSVWSLIGGALPNSIALVVPAFVLSVVLGLPLGVIAATVRNRAVRSLLDLFAIIGIALPMFWVGLLLILIFAVDLHWLPSARMETQSSYVLPVITLAFFITAGLLRLMRSSVLDELQLDYVTLLRLKGMSEWAVVWKHVFKNSLGSAAAFVGLFFSVLIAGSIVTERVFAWPGEGQLIYNGILQRDFPLIQGTVLVAATAIIVVNLLFEFIQAWLDPRIRV